MAPAEETYRRLPGRRRGLISAASLWMGSDHILLVKSAWFREEYKRFYLRDIQAIVVAPGPRFYISTPMLVFAVVWLFSGLFMSTWPASVAIGWGVAGTAMLAAWLGVSFATGCRCRLYTAVSRDELPSLYRTWTARRFLDKVQPRIEQVQGRVDAAWAEAERTSAGPLVAAMAPAEPTTSPAAPSHTPASDLFALSLVVSGIVGIATIRSQNMLWNHVNNGLTLVQLAGAIVVLVQYSRRNLGRFMQRIAIISLVLTGLAFYVQSFSVAFNGTVMGAGAASLFVMRPYVIVHQAIYGLQLLLGFLCAVMTLRATYNDETDIIKD